MSIRDQRVGTSHSDYGLRWEDSHEPLSKRFMDEGSFRVINNQPLNPSEEKEIVCRTDYLTPLTVDPPIQSCCCGLVGMVEEVMLTYLHCGFDPLLHLTHTKKQEETEDVK